MTVVHSYIRFSTVEQAEGDSLDRQLDRAQEFCRRHGYTLSTLKFHDLGVSSFRLKNLKNSALAAFLVAIQKGKIKRGDILLVEAIDRLSRSGVRATRKLIDEIHEAGVDIAIIFPSERVFKHNSKDQFMDTILLAAYADVAHQYSLRLSDFGKRWWTRQRKKAVEDGTPIAAVIPSWLERKGDKFIAKPEMVRAIKQIFKLAIKGYGAHRICDYLNRQGYKPPRKNWNKTFVRSVIRDRRVLGEMQFCDIAEDGSREPIGDPIQNYYPSIIKEGEWILANDALDGRTQDRSEASGYINILKSMVWNVNDDCPAQLSTYQQPRKKNGKITHKVTIRRWKSAKAINQEVDADTATVDVDALEKAVLFTIQKVDVASLQDDNEEKIEERDLKTAQLEQIKKNIEAMNRDLQSGDTDYAFLKKNLKDSQIRQVELEQEIRRIEAQSQRSASASFNNLLKLVAMESVDRVEIREAIRKVVDRILIKPIKTGEKRSDAVIAFCQILYKSGERNSFAFEKLAGRPKKGGNIRLISNIDLPDLESSKHRNSKFLYHWKKEKSLSL